MPDVLKQDPFVIKQGDTAPSYTAVLIDKGGYVDLTAAEKVRFLMRAEASEDPNAPDVQGEMSFSEEEIPDPDNPEATIKVWVIVYDWQAGDLDLPAGDYNVEFEVTWESGKIESFPADEEMEYLALKLLEDLG